MENAIDKLIDKIKQMDNPTVIGLDPRYSMIPECITKKYDKTIKGACEAILEFNKALIDATYDIIPAVKPQIAFYEMFGTDGIEIFNKTCKYSGLVLNFKFLESLYKYLEFGVSVFLLSLFTPGQ